MKILPSVLLLLTGALVGSMGTIGVYDWRRMQAIRALPSLDDRTQVPFTDELPTILLYRSDGHLHSEVRDGMGAPRKDIAEQVALHRRFSDRPLTFAIYFEPGVTMKDLEATVEELSDQGVERYFFGWNIYGKRVGY